MIYFTCRLLCITLPKAIATRYEDNFKTVFYNQELRLKGCAV